ncbi:MAG: alpha/beta fold hydrolase [Gammaproteobacteria bacterium]
MSTITANGIEIYYEIHGSGEPLLLIMGLGANATAWYLQIPEFSRQHQVIAFDNRGAGRSDKPNEPYTIAQMADDAAGLLDALNVTSAHVFGVSLGGMIAQELTLRHPQRVRTLILGATMCGGPRAAFAGAELVQQFVSLASLPMEQAAERGLSILYSEGFIQQNRERLVRRALEVSHLMPPMYAIQRQFMALIGFNTYDRLASIRTPTLVLSGTADRVIPAPNSQLITEAVPGARLIEFPAAGHGFLVECADEVNAAVLEFLRSHHTESVSPK